MIGSPRAGAAVFEAVAQRWQTHAMSTAPAGTRASTSRGIEVVAHQHVGRPARFPQVFDSPQSGQRSGAKVIPGIMVCGAPSD